MKVSLVALLLAFTLVASTLPFTAFAAAWSGLPAGEINFGQSAPFTGSWEPAPAFNRGLLGAFNEINVNEGGVNGRLLKLTALDDQYNKTQTVINVNSLVANPNIFALVGTMGSPTSLAAMNIATPSRSWSSTSAPATSMSLLPGSA